MQQLRIARISGSYSHTILEAKQRADGPKLKGYCSDWHHNHNNKNRSVAYSSQGNLIRQIDSATNWRMVARRNHMTMKSINVDFPDDIRYLSIE